MKQYLDTNLCRMTGEQERVRKYTVSDLCMSGKLHKRQLSVLQLAVFIDLHTLHTYHRVSMLEVVIGRCGFDKACSIIIVMMMRKVIVSSRCESLK